MELASQLCDEQTVVFPLSETILGFAHIGTEVNLETDIAGRYIRHFMNLGSEPTEEKPKKSMQSLLVENGFI